MQFRQQLVVGSCLAAILAGAAYAQDETRQQKPLERKLEQLWFPPELVLHYAERLEISDQQRAEIENQFRRARKTLEARQADLHAAKQRLYEKVAGDASEDEVLKQLDEVLDNERTVKRLHMATLLRIRRQLTPEQLSEIRELKQGFQEQQRELQQDIQAKISRIQQFVQKRAAAAQPPEELREKMKEFEALMKRGKAREAQAALDRILEEFVENNND